MFVELRARHPLGYGLPAFVEHEFMRYLDCGILAHGFLRVHCGSCGHDRLVAFSCKPRGLCPSCTTRRMQDTAAHLVDRVLPDVPYPAPVPCLATPRTIGRTAFASRDRARLPTRIDHRRALVDHSGFARRP